jgi:O-antigen ligase/polysaccharide polymerase Wzy-like membrane protein
VEGAVRGVGAARWVAAGAVLAGPTVLAFARGGFFDEARLWAAIAAWVLAAVAAVVAPRALPRSAPGIVALAGLAGLLAWTVASRDWAPLHGPAIDDAERIALYLGALVAATALLRGGPARIAVPALAAGTVVVVGYGLSERLLPGVIDLATSRSANGRLEQPLTYWNAMGALAAIGLVLCARLAGGRPALMRALAAAAAAPLGAGVALSFSRGAIAAAVIGLAALAVLDPRRPALRGVAAVAAAGVVAGAVAVALPAVRTLEGARESQGLVMLATLVVVAVAAALVVRAAVDDGGRDRAAVRVRARHVVAALLAVAAVTAGTAALEVTPEASNPDTGATAQRLSSTDSNRYSYWRVALRAFEDAPLRGHGSGSFQVDWLRERDVAEAVRDAHSLPLETGAELGIVGVILLGLFVGGIVAAAVVAHRRDGAAAIGPIAALGVYAVHSALDWDWEMPALTLVAICLAGLLMAAADELGGERRLRH